MIYKCVMFKRGLPQKGTVRGDVMEAPSQRPLIDSELAEAAKAILQKLARNRNRSGRKPKRIIEQHAIEVWPDGKVARAALKRLVAMRWVQTAPHLGEKRYWLNWSAINEIKGFL